MKCGFLFLCASTIFITPMNNFGMEQNLQIPVRTDTIQIIKIKLRLNELILNEHTNATGQFSEPELQLFMSNTQQLKLLLKTIDTSQNLLAQVGGCSELQENTNAMTLDQALSYFQKLHKMVSSDK